MKRSELENLTAEAVMTESIETQVDWYVLNEERLKAAEKTVKQFADIKKNCVALIDPDLPKDEGVTITGEFGEFKATKCVVTSALDLTPEKAIKKFGLAECMSSISINAKLLTEALGKSALKKFTSEKIGNRKFQKITKL